MAERSLQDFVEQVNGEGHLRVEHDFGDGFVRLRTSEADRRQAAQDIKCSEDIVLELLRNSRDAHASNIFMAVAKEGARRTIVVIDDGDGIPPAMHDHVFEPRVTSKLDTSHMDAWGLHGRGMALFSIRQNALSAEVAASDAELGCALAVEADTERLSEKTDQSSFPRFIMGEEGNVNVRGPRNILRCACEFAIESRDTCSVRVGSPAEIAAALFAHGNATLSVIDRAFCRDVDALPVVKRLATAADPRDLASLAATLGLSISSRTARRIADGEVEEAEPLLDRIVIEGGASGRGKSKSRKAPGGKPRVKVQRTDAAELADPVMAAFAPIAERYFLDAEVEPNIKVARDKLTISIPLVDVE